MAPAVGAPSGRVGPSGGETLFHFVPFFPRHHHDQPGRGFDPTESAGRRDEDDRQRTVTEEDGWPAATKIEAISVERRRWSVRACVNYDAADGPDTTAAKHETLYGGAVVAAAAAL
jgi:hypothetical protein